MKSPRVVFLTDLHLNETKGLPDGWLPKILRGVAEQSPDVILLGGDYCDKASTPQERCWLVALVLGLAEFAPVVAIRGNHDARGDFDFFNHLRSPNEIVYVEEPSRFVPKDSPVAVVALPWLDRAQVSGDWHQGVRARYADSIAEAHKALSLVKAGDAMATSLPVVLVGHGALRGGVVKVGQPSLPFADPVLDPAVVCPGWLAGAFWGHYHEPQTVKAPCPTVYGGALFVREYGEQDNRGWSYMQGGAIEREVLPQASRVVLDVTGGSLPQIVAMQPEWEGWVGAAVTDLPDGVNAYVKARVHLEEGEDAAVVVSSLRAALEARFLDVRVEVIARRQTRTRDGAEEVATARTVTDKVSAYFGRIQPEPAADLQQGALRLLGELEGRNGA